MSLYCLWISQQTRNHFWTSWHVSYWFIIGTAPPVCVFMCIHVNTRVLPVVTSFERVWHESHWVRTGTVSLVCVITWKNHDFPVNTCRHIKFVHSIRWNTWIEPVELVNSLIEHVKPRVIVCWDITWKFIACSFTLMTTAYCSKEGPHKNEWWNLLLILTSAYHVERNGSGVELRTLDYENPGSNPGCGVKIMGKFFHSTLLQFTQLNKWVPGYRQWWICVRAAFAH